MCGPGDRALGFDAPIPDGGYAWWYFDVISEDGQYALTFIFFVGSVFSPRYFSARQEGLSFRAEDHCGINAVLYHRRHGRWVMTEVPHSRIVREPHRFQISGSSVTRSGNKVVIELNEKTAPFGRSFGGRVELELFDGLSAPLALDRNQDHGWWPVGARARAEVRLDAPQLSFSGSAYHDCNFGLVPLEASFRGWTWSRAELGSGVGLLYDTVERDGYRRDLGVWLHEGQAHPIAASHCMPLGKGRWGVRDEVRSDTLDPAPRLLQRLEDTPFYNRSLVETSLRGRTCTAVHETLDLQRFCRSWVQFLLPFRIRQEK